MFFDQALSEQIATIKAQPKAGSTDESTLAP